MKLDSNGYAPSIMETSGCWFCDRRGSLYLRLQRHEVFHGPNREKSKRLGTWVTLCQECHMMLHHTTPSMDRLLKREGQKAAMKHYGWTVEDFRGEFGKNYLEAEQ